MEVHHHSHLASGETHTARKKWTHYFREFLMLFLAVFCGFLAEYKLEHVIEKDKARVYVNNLYHELEKDTARLNYLTNRYKFVSAKLDTFCLFASEQKQRNVTNGMLYYYASYMTSLYLFSSQNATIEQLKGSGNLRLLKMKVERKVSEYDRMVRELAQEYALSASEFQSFEEVHFKVFDVYKMESVLTFPGRPERDSVFSLSSLPITNDALLMREYIGWAKHNSHILQYHVIAFLQPINRVAGELIELIKSEYHLQ